MENDRHALMLVGFNNSDENETVLGFCDTTEEYRTKKNKEYEGFIYTTTIDVEKYNDEYYWEGDKYNIGDRLTEI